MSKKENTRIQPGRIGRACQKVKEKATNVSLPGFENIPIHDVISFFIRGIQKGSLTTRASSIAFHFFMALLPAIIFFFTLIPYIPVNNFQEGILSLSKDIFPEDVYNVLESTLKDMFKKRSALTFIGFMIAMIFSTNGFNAMIIAFNETYHTVETRSWLERRIVALVLVIIIFILLTTAISLIVFSRVGVRKLVETGMMRIDLTYYLLMAGKWIIVFALIFSAISFLYYLAPSRKSQWRFFSAGSTLATILTVLTSLIFSYFFNHFGQLNKFYGSIGTLIMTMLWLYFNAIALLIGFELNASIKNARLELEDNNDQL